MLCRRRALCDTQTHGHQEVTDQRGVIRQFRRFVSRHFGRLIVVRRHDNCAHTYGAIVVRWAVEIQKTTLERRNLEDLLCGLGFRVLEAEHSLVFVSEEMRRLATAAEAFELAKRVRAAMTGPSGVDSEFQLGSVLDFASDPPRRHAFLEIQSVVMRVSSGSATLTVGPPKGLSETELHAWKAKQAEREYQAKLERQRVRLEPAFRSARAEKVLSLLSQDDPSGETLYKIYELAEGHPTKRAAFQAQFGIDPAEFRRFQDAVHNPAVSGDWARHAYLDKPRSDQPMSRAEANQFVRGIAAKWLDSVRKSA